MYKLGKKNLLSPSVKDGLVFEGHSHFLRVFQSNYKLHI